jgi:hypothetical protein
MRRPVNVRVQMGFEFPYTYHTGSIPDALLT